MEKEIKTIFFDLGNVLVRFDINILIKGYSSGDRLSPERLESFIMDSPTGKKYMEGRISSSTFYSNTKRELRLKVRFREFFDIWNSMFEPYPEMEEMVKNLRSKHPHIKLILVSDTNEAHFDFIKANYPVLELFDNYILSYETGKMKPHHKIYNAAMKEAGCPAKNILYVDDRLDLVRSARAMGIRAHHFVGHQELDEKLSSKYGIGL